MSAVITILGIVGIAIALAAIVETAVVGVRTRRYLDFVIVIVVAALTVWLLLTWGDVLLR